LPRLLPCYRIATLPGAPTAESRPPWHPGLSSRGISKGSTTLSATTAIGTIGATLANPFVAGLLGLGLGIGLLLVSSFSARMMTPDDPEIGFARVAVALIIRMAVAFLALLCYFLWLRPGLVPFGVGLVVGFFAMIVVELFTLGRRSAPSVR
jgi:hypothetical protein